MKLAIQILFFLLTSLTVQAQQSGSSRDGNVSGGKAFPKGMPKGIVIKSADAANYIGKTVSICDVVSTGKNLSLKSKSDPTELYIGGAYPDSYFIIVIRENVRKSFSYDPEEKLVNKRFCITGKMLRYKGKPAIFVSNENQINEED